jgi:RNA polymerase sigma-70 factor (ECF subfamily)
MPPDSHFPDTRWSVVLEAQAGDSAVRRRALEAICRMYWLPVYAYARGQGLAPADAEDVTQGVLARLVESGAFERVDARLGTLRSFLRVAAKNYLRGEWRKEGRRKRGGGAERVSLDWAEAEDRCALEAVEHETPETLFDRHWGLNLLQRTMERLGAQYTQEGKGEVFDGLRDVLGHGGGLRYRELGDRLGLSEGAVKVAVHRLRRRFRAVLRDEIARTLDDPCEAAVEEEIRHLFGVFAG